MLVSPLFFTLTSVRHIDNICGIGGDMVRIICPKCNRPFDHFGKMVTIGPFCIRCKRYDAVSKIYKADTDNHLSTLYNSKDITPEILENAYKAGMMRKSQLTDKHYYVGSCRNASIAIWDEANQCFWYMRTKWGSSFSESIRHPEDDDGYDIFQPYFEDEPDDNERVRDKE